MEGVLKGEKAPDNAVGRKLLDLVNSVPKMSPEEFEKMVNSNMKVSSLASPHPLLHRIKTLLIGTGEPG